MSRIFVIEDDALLSEDIEGMLRGSSHEVVGATRFGSGALAAMYHAQADLLLVDIDHAGSLNGTDLAASVYPRPPVPVLYVTRATEELPLTSRKEGAAHSYLGQPFSGGDLCTAIELALKKHQVEGAVADGEHSYFRALSSVHDAVIASDAQARVSFMNDVAERLIGWKLEDAVGKPVRELLSVAPHLFARSEISQTMGDGLEARALGSVIIFRDAAERERLQRRLSLAERLASISIMAATLAHEINNPLAATVANVDFAAECIDELSAKPDAVSFSTATAALLRHTVDALADAQSAAMTVRRIVFDLKKFARAEKAELHLVDLTSVLQTALTQLRPLSSDIVLEILADPTPNVVADEGRLVQVFSNLIGNAIQAVRAAKRTGGRVSLATRTDAQGRAIVEISDNGVGIEAHLKDRVFEPFFTTRHGSGGLGLGLSICRTIIQAAGGELTFESELGRGTTFKIALPAGPLTPEAARPATRPPPKLPRRGRVLLIDDDVALTRTVTRILETEHDVHVVTSAREGLVRLESDSSYDVVLCDVGMAELSGVQFYERLAATASELTRRVVFLTGGATSASHEQFLETSGNVIVHKPFSVHRLRAVVASFVR